MAKEVKPVNLPAAMPDTRVNFIPSMDEPQQQQPTENFHQVFESLINQAAPKTGTALPVISTSGIDTSGRYPKYYTGLDNESLYAENQGFFEKGFNGVTKLSGVAGATFINGTVGIVNGLYEWGKSGKFNSFYNNDLSNSLNDFTESLTDKYAFYKTERERNGNWWEPQNLISGNMLFDNIIGNMGFMVGAGAAGILTGGLFSAALKGLGAAAGLVSTGVEGAATADAILGEAAALSTAESLGAASNRLQGAWSAAKTKIGQGISSSDRVIKSIAATAGEAGLEALNNSREFRQKMISNYTSKYGTAPTGKDLEDINKYAESVGNASFALNTAVLSVSNYVMLPKVFSSSFKSEKTLLSGIGRDLTGEYVSTLPTQGLAKYAYGASKGLGAVFARSEALEEGAQYAIQTGTQNYFGRKVRNQDASIINDMVGFGLKETLTSDEGLLNMFIGGVSGGLVTAGLVSRGADGKYGLFKGGTVGQRGFFGFGGEEARIREEALPALNATQIKKKLLEANSNIAAAVEIQEERKQKIADGDIFEAKNLETDYAHTFIDTRMKYGAEQLVYDEIEDLRQQALTDFVALQKEGIAAPLDTKESFLARLDAVQAQAKLTETLNKELTVKYGTILDEDGKRKYSDKTIDMLTYSMVKVKDFSNRINQMSAELAENNIFTDKMLDAIISGDEAALSEAYKELDVKIAELGKTQSVSEVGEAFQLIKDTSKAARYRKAYLDEYNSIFTTPEEFTTEEEPSAPTEEGATAPKKATVKVKTFDGEEDLEVGTQYFTGGVADKTSSDKNIIEFPVFTVLGENEDGTIRLRNDETGFIKNYDKAVLSKFKLGKVEDAKKNRKALFFMEHVNTVFEMNFGKDKKTGKSRKKKGRLTYSPKDGVLIFNYINDWNKPDFIEVKNKHFVAQGDYKKPMLEAIGKLTPNQQKALDNFINDKTPDPRVLEKVRTIAGTLELIFEDTMETLEGTKRDIENKAEQLAKIEQELDKLTAKVEGPNTITEKTKRFKATTHRTIQAISNLTKLRDSLKKDLALLEAEQSELELRLEDLLNTAAALEEYPGDYQEFYETVRQERNNLEDAILETGLQINKLSDLIDLVEGGLEKAYKTAKALIDKFFDKYPNVPLDRIGIIDFLNRNIEANKLEREEMQRTTSYAEAEKILPYVAVAGNLLEDINKLDADLAQIDEIDVIPNEPLIAGLRDELKALNEKLKQYEEQLSAKEGTLKKLSDLYALHKAEREKMEAEELEVARNTEAFREEFLGTADTSVPSLNYDSNYEPDPKKDWMDVLRATTAPTRKFAGEPLREHHLRANKFGIDLESFDNRKADKIRGVFITQANEAELGLGGTMVNGEYVGGLMNHLKGDSDVDASKTVALVMVQQNTDGSISLVGVDGNVIESENSEQLINQAIYQTMPDPKLRWSNDEKESMFRDDVPETTQEYYREVYKKKIQDILDNPSLQTYRVTPSFGTPDITTYPDQTNPNGTPKKNYGATNSVKDAGLITVNDEKDDLVEQQLITVPTTSETISKGSTSFTDALGRIFLELPNAYVKLKNANLTEAQVNAIYDAVLRLSVIGKIKGNAEATELINWLRTVIYWGTPKDRATGEAKPLSYNSLFFDSTEEGFMLFISGKGNSIPFTPKSIRDNKANIVSALQKMYHNVNSARVNGDSWKKPYTEILSVSEKGERQEREWQNYQTYLLSSEGRRGNEIPLTTNIRPIEGPNDVNRSGVYFVANTNLDAYAQAPQPQAPAVKGKVLGGNQPVAQPTATPAKQEGFELDGLSENKLPILNGTVTITFIADKDNFYSPDGGYNLMGLEIPKEAVAILQEKFNTKDDAVIQSKVSAFVIKTIKPQVDAYLASKEAPAVEELTEEPVVAAAAPVSTESVDYVKAANVENRRKRDLAKPIEEVIDNNNPYFEKGTWITSGGEFSGATKQEVIDKINAKHDAALAALEKPKVAPAETFVEPESTVDDPTIETISDMDDIDPDDKPAAEYRIANDNYTKEKLAREDWPKFEAWLKQNFPNIPVYRVKNMIQATNGRQAWGMLKNGAIYITENALVGTGYHEVFEAVWKAMTPIEEQVAILNEMKSRQGEFFDEMSYKMVKYSAATDKQLKEKLADEFSEFIQTGKKPAAPSTGKSFIRQLFEDLINMIKEFFTGEKAMSNTEKLFSKIGNGYYAQYNAYESRLSFAKEGVIDIQDAFGDETSEYSLAGFTDMQWNDLMQSMTYLTMSELIVNKKSIFEVANINKDALYSRIKGNIGYRLKLARKQLKDEVAAGKKNAQQSASSIKGYEVLYQNIMNNWNQIVASHEEYILPYQIDFDENDNVLLRNEENSGKEDYLDATKIDSFKKANSALKLFLASLPEVDTNGNVILSTVSGERLIPVSKVEMTLRNTISDSRNPDEMIGKLKTLADNDASYKLLYDRMTYGISNFNLSKMTSDHHIQLVSALWRTFKKTAPEVKYVYILTNGDVVIDGSNFTKASDQAFQDMEGDMIMYIKDPKSPYFTYDKDQNAYVGKPGGLPAKPNTLEESIKFLSDIGLQFTTDEILSKPQFRTEFDAAVGGIYDSIKAAKKIASINSNTLDIRGRLRELAQIRAVITNPEFDATFYNINGELTQSFIGTNVHSDLYDYISQANNLSELENTSFAYLMTGADAFTQNSVKIGELFNRKTGRAIADRKDSGLLKNGWVDGVYNALKNNRTQSSRLNYRNRLVQQLNLMIKGYYANLVPGDSGLDHMTKMGNSVDFTDTYANQMKEIKKIFKGYFIDELAVSREKRPIVAPEGSGRLTTDLRFFKNILPKDVHDEIVLGKVNQDKSVAQVYEAYEGKINTAVENYLNKNRESYARVLNTYGLITNQVTEQEEQDDTQGIENVAIGKDLSPDELQSRLFGIVANFAINNIEFHKLVYGDPYRYTDMLKRAKNFNSPHQAIVYGSNNFNIAADKVYNKNYKPGDIAYTDFSKDGLITATVQDIDAIADYDGYRDLWEEGDGGGIVTLKGVRQMRINASEWSPADEKQFLYEVAYEKADKDLPMSPEESIALANGNPGVQSAFTPRKPIGVGNLGDKQWNNPILDKFALYPISYRMAKEIGVKSENNNLVKLYDRMQASDVDYVVFRSARKVGSDVIHPVYDAKTGNFITDSFGTLEDGGVNKIPFAILSGQSEVPTKESSTVTTGSQPTKLMTLDLMDAGVPLDFEEGKDFTERYKMWNELPSEEAKIDASPLYKEIKNNQSLIEAMIVSGMEDAMNILGIAKEGNAFVIRDLSKAGSTLRAEILKREVNRNIMKSLDGFLRGESVIEATPAYQQIRNILYSIADKNIISRTMTGGQKVQIPSSFLEENRIGKELINGKEGYTSKDLRFYWDLDEDGNRIKVAEVMVRRWFDNDTTKKMSDKQLLDYLNTTEEGKNLLKGIAFRIPTQKQNSIDVFRIAKFLPKEFGDAVVIPSALVKKVGSDFDIDKLFMYFKNVVFNSKGLPSPVKYLDYNNSSREERYYNWVLEKADRDIVKYIRFLTKGQVAELKKQFKQRFQEINKSYKTAIDEAKTVKYNDLLNTFASIKRTALSQQDEYMIELFNTGAGMFKTLGNEVKDEFFNLKRQLAIKNVNGPEEIRKYLALASVLSTEESVSDEDKSTLENMISVYEEELKVLGASQAEVDKATAAALAEYRKDKSAAIKSIGEIVSNFISTEVTPQQQELANAQKMEIASEIAEKSKLDSFDMFIRRPIMLQNTKAALQNAYIDSSEKLVTSDYNFDQLVKPNSAKELKKLSIDLDKDLSVEQFDYASTDITLRPEVMARLRYGYQAGKSVIGIAAQAQTLHSLLQRSAFVIDKEKRKYLSTVDKAWLGDMEIKFAKFNTVDGKPSLSGRKTADGKQFISDTNGMIIDGSVDITKDDWLIRLGVTPNVAATYLFLVHLGVNINDIAYFMKQPIIRDYLRMIENQGYSYLFIDDYVNSLVRSPKYRSSSSAKVEQIPSFSKLQSVIRKDAKDLTEDEKLEQQFMLMEFLKYAKMAEQLFYVSQGTNFDTANLNDPFLIFKKQEQLAIAKTTIFSDVNTFMNSSFLGSLEKAAGDMRNGIANFLVSDQGEVRNTIQTVLSKYVTKNDYDFLKIAQTTVSNLFDWAVQNDKALNARIEEILISETGTAKEVNDFLESIKEGHPLYGNYIVEALEVRPAQKPGQANNMYIKNKANKVYDQNRTIYAFDELRSYLESQGKAKLYDDLITLSVLQSGLRNSSVSFTALLPYEDFVKIYGETLSYITEFTNLDVFTALNVLARSNWNNTEIVPSVKAPWIKTKKGKMLYNPGLSNAKFSFVPKKVVGAVNNGSLPTILQLSTKGVHSDADVISYSWEEGTTKQKKEMRKNSDYSYIKRALFQKVYTGGTPLISPYKNKEGVLYESFVYKAINAWGQGVLGNEFYMTEQASKFNNGYNKFEKAKKIVPITDESGRQLGDRTMERFYSGEVSDDAVISIYGDLGLDLTADLATMNELAETEVTPSKLSVESLLTKLGAKKVSKGMLNIDGQYWYLDKKYWSIMPKPGGNELFIYPDGGDMEISIGFKKDGDKTFISELSSNDLEDITAFLSETTKDNEKTPIEGLKERLDSYGNAKVILSPDFNEGARPTGRLNSFKSSIIQVADNLQILADLNLNEFNFLTESDKKRLDALKPLATELRKLNTSDISSATTRTVAVEKRFAQLSNQLANEFVDIIGKHVEQQLGKKITSSQPSITTKDKDWTKVNNTSENPFEC
jgi:hypothetical protein